MTIISVKIYLSKLVTRTWGSAPPPYLKKLSKGKILVICLCKSSDVDPDPVGPVFIWVRESGSGARGTK